MGRREDLLAASHLSRSMDRSRLPIPRRWADPQKAKYFFCKCLDRRLHRYQERRLAGE